jgi:hypothetical protein
MGLLGFPLKWLAGLQLDDTPPQPWPDKNYASKTTVLLRNVYH